MNARKSAFAITLALAGCNSPKVTQPMNEDMVNATRDVQPVVDLNNQQESDAPAVQDNGQASEQAKPEQVVAEFGRLLHARQFADAFELVDGQAMGMDEKAFAARFAHYRTIDAEVGKIGPTEGAAGSLYSQVALTLSGNTDSGSPYAVTGPLTLRRVNDVPGSTAEQRRWHIVKMELTAKPRD